MSTLEESLRNLNYLSANAGPGNIIGKRNYQYEQARNLIIYMFEGVKEHKCKKKKKQ